MSLPRQIAIRADASAGVGVGHVMRCLVIADELARCGIATAFLSRELTDWAALQITQRGHTWRKLDCPAEEQADAVATRQACQDLRAKLLLVDHYDLKTAWCSAVRSGPMRLCVIDDFAQTRRDVDLLIDPGLGREAGDYAGLVPQDTPVLAGPAFGLLRPEFALLRASSAQPPRDMQHVVISMGGSDPAGHTAACLEALDGLQNLRVTAVLTRSAPHLDAVLRRAAQMRIPAQLLVDHGDMAGLMASADLALGAGGGSALERCVLGIASLLSVQAPNQQFNADKLAAAGAVEVMRDMAPAPLRAQIAAVLADPARMEAMALAGRALCDGKGGARAALAIVHLCSDARLRAAGTGDMRAIFEMQAAPGARQFSRNPEPPDWDTHCRWFDRRLGQPDPFYVIEAQGAPLGFVRLNRAAPGGGHEVSVLLAAQARGQVHGRAALAQLRLMHPSGDIAASVHPENAPSQALFSAAGFTRIAKDAFVSTGWGAAARPLEKDVDHAD